MDEHGDDMDERAAAALQALREGRSAGGVGSVGWRESLRLLAEGHNPLPVRPLVVLGVVGVALALTALAWSAVRPVDAPAADGGVFAGSAVTDPGAVGGATSATSTSTTVATLAVHAAGAVLHPGVYHLPSSARVADLLDAAGGPTLDTDLDRLNLAAPLADGQRVYVPRLGEPVPPSVGGDGGGSAQVGGGAAAAAPAALIDVNSATVEQLDTLPGVGPATATAIVTHRDRNGPFATVDDLLDVRGIGPAKLDALRELVTVG